MHCIDTVTTMILYHGYYCGIGHNLCMTAYSSKNMHYSAAALTLGINVLLHGSSFFHEQLHYMKA